MYTKVMCDQFELKDGSIIHTPTGAEFTPVTGTPDSILIWTGDILDIPACLDRRHRGPA